MLSISERRNNDYKIELLKAIKSLPFPRIKDLVSAKGIPADPTFLDYAALNCSLEHGRKDVANFLLNLKCRVNKVSRLLTKPSNTPLHYAIKLGDLELVQKLLEKNASMTAVNSQGNSPLHLAFVLREDRMTDIILDFILQTATFANPGNNHGLTHLHIAITRKNVSLVLSFMKIASNLTDKVNEDSPYYPGYSVMQFAIESKSPLILKLLLENGGSSLTKQNKSTLALLQKDFEDISLMTYLLSSYARMEPHSKLSEFHIACMRNNPTLVGTFLDHGAAVNNAVSEDSAFCPLYTPLHYAAETNCKESVGLLLQHGADADFQDANYMTALHVAMYNDQQEIAEMLWAATKNKLADGCDRNGLGYFHVAIVRNDVEIVKKFLDKKQDVNARVFQNLRNFSNYTPLHFAVRYGHVGIVKLLVGQGANVHASDVHKHGTPLQMAFAAGHRGLIEFFLKVDPRVDLRRPNDNKTLLHLLVEAYMDDGKRSMLLIVEKLVEKLVMGYGLDVNAKDSDGYTALHYACTKISVGAECAKVLLKYGADINIENNVGDTPFEVSFYDMYRNNAEDYMVLYDHVKGLKTLGFAVNSKNDECCERLLREKDECQPNAECFRPTSLEKKTQETVKEILKLKELMLSKDVSVYQFLLMSEGSLRKFDANLETLKALVEGELIKEFKCFGYRVMIQWMKLLMVRAAGAVAAF